MKVGIAAVLFALTMLSACVDLAVYGPHDDYSTLSNDFISESVKKNLRTGQPFGNNGMAHDAYLRFLSAGMDLQRIRGDLESANAVCVAEQFSLHCDANRKWTVVTPRPTRDLDGQLRIERVEQINAVISYHLTTEKDRQLSVEVNVKYITR